jgi:hypothetical protein
MRPNRLDPHDVSGWSDYVNSRLNDNKNDDSVFGIWESNDAVDRRRRTNMIDQVQELEQRYEQEDEDMMIRLIKLRQYLWT